MTSLAKTAPLTGSIAAPSLDALGRRICVIGPTASGKSTFTVWLSTRLDIEPVFLDRLAHVPGTAWALRPREEFERTHNAILRNEAWIIDGNFSYTMRKRFESATSVIWLDQSPVISVFRYVRRSLLQKARTGDVDGSPTHHISPALIAYTLHTYPKRRHEIEALLTQTNLPYIRTFSMRQTRRLMRDLEA